MAQQRSPGKAWTNSEDEKLIEAVQKYGENTESWKTIAEAVPGRTNKACRKRWKHSLHPSIKKTPWEPEEDELLLKLYAQHPGRWALIANHITGRTDDACAKRYREALDPNLKKDDWTKEEDERLLEGFGRHGVAWGKIGEELGRSGLGCRNRWRLLERRKNAAERRKVKPASAESSKSKKTKRKREPTEDDTADGEISEAEEPRPGPSRRRLSTVAGSVPPPPERSDTSETLLADSVSPDPPCPPLAEADFSPTLGGGPVIDQAIIGMALGKCPCGCASGTSPCNCTSTNPALSLAPNSQSIDSLDWVQLFPYLHAELPTVFVDPPLPPAGESLNPSTSINMYQGASALQDLVRNQGRKCNRTSSGGCCSSEQKKSSCCSNQPSASSCCQQDPPAPNASHNDAAHSNRMHPESDAEAAKLVLDYATFLLQRQQGALVAHAPIQHAQTSSGLSLNRNSSPPASCQTPASHWLIGIIEKYQQQKSTPPSNAASGLLSNIPLPTGSAGCDCGCGDANPTSTEDLPQPYFPAASEVAPMSLQNTVGGPSTPAQAAGLGNGALAPSRSCCGGNKEASDMIAPSLEQHQATLHPTPATIPPYFPSLGAEPIPALPSYVPGCTCGCAAGTPAGSCSCGCTGICLCGFQGGEFQPLELTSKPTVSGTNDLIILTTQAQTVGQQAKSGGCCGGGSKDHEAAELEPTLAMTIPSAGSISMETSLPSFIPGCECGCAAGIAAGLCSCGCFGVCCCASKLLEADPTSLDVKDQSAIALDQPRGGAERTLSHSRNPSLETTPSCCTPSTPTIAASTPKLSNNAANHRLSAQHPAPLPAYACGHPDCWRLTEVPLPSMHEFAGVAFKTSAELMEHRRIVHGTEAEESGGLGRGTGPNGSWLFRCGLAGCEKGWKSINGMQYHLQLAKVHFAGPSRELNSPDGQGEKGDSEDVPYASSVTKAFKCPREGCTNAYKQAAGLKYHLAHGHPAVQPVQFEVL